MLNLRICFTNLFKASICWLSGEGDGISNQHQVIILTGEGEALDKVADIIDSIIAGQQPMRLMSNHVAPIWTMLNM